MTSKHVERLKPTASCIATRASSSMFPFHNRFSCRFNSFKICLGFLFSLYFLWVKNNLSLDLHPTRNSLLSQSILCNIFMVHFCLGKILFYFIFFYSSFCVATVTAFDICLAIPEPCSFEKWKCIHNAPRITHCPFYYKLHYLWYE